ncbi:hypothetical protein ROZALSC1DRAFT_12035 [Rozella allomycis CSF55]|uniref:Endoglucanase n=1 Tax=Rozella allomycis (strain CSF55) TaxID=988480 RepID=A0A4P9YQH6_ROZAC|nr:hypothetical protein ROZALSC1DRAFT_12035 [Rozella allomycis CSF55]
MTVPVPRQGTDNSPAKELCQGRHAGGSTTTLTAGSLIEVVISGGAPHGGGGCLFSLSYDGGHTFKVISSTDKSCPINHNYQVMIPQNAPSGNAVFAWSWVPVLSGQPEYYMNCADVTIVGGNGSGFNGPNLPIYNMPGSTT